MRGLLARILVLAAALALGGCARVAREAPATASLLTFNLYHDKADWPTRRALIVDGIATLRPDVVVLQEVLQDDALRNQAEDLAAALGYEATFISIDPPSRARRYGNAILTRQPVLARDWRALRPLDDSRTVGMVRIDVRGAPLEVYATHLHHEDTPEGARKRAEQLADLLDFVERTTSGAPRVIAGDFNVAAGRPELSALTRGHDEAFSRLHSGDPRPTLNPHYFPTNARRIDQVFLQRGALAPIEARIVLDREGAPGVWPSDHFGVFVRFAIRALR